MPLRRSVPSFRHRSPWGLLAAPLLGLLLLACGGGGGSTAAAPAIAGFTVVQDPVTAGTGAQLTATFSGGTGVVDPGVGTVNSGETRTTPALTADTVFTLTVIGTGGTASRTATVHVAPVPARPVLTLPAAAVAGETGCTASTPTVAGLTYAWSVAGGELTAGDGTGQITFTAGSAGTLQVTCVARNAAGASESASSTIPVQAEPIISHFQASPASIPFGQSSTLTWSVVGATSLRIDPGVGAVTGGAANTEVLKSRKRNEIIFISHLPSLSFCLPKASPKGLQNGRLRKENNLSRIRSNPHPMEFERS